jgi:methylase of polypeptide subunit release factors
MGDIAEGNDSCALRRPADAFWDEAESDFYAQCVQAFLLRNHRRHVPGRPIMELGSGTGQAIARVLSTGDFPGEIIGYELQAETCFYAQRSIAARGIAAYQIVHGDFFEAVGGKAVHCVISNPPYLPAPDDEISVPELWGGPDGSAVTRRLLNCGFELLVTTLSSFADPVGSVEFARDQGYRAADFAVRTIAFGTYSSEPKVRSQIDRLAADGRRAFVTPDRYSLACVLWTRDMDLDITESLISAITCLRQP